jgi:hypothetical protein
VPATASAATTPATAPSTELVNRQKPRVDLAPDLCLDDRNLIVGHERGPDLHDGGSQVVASALRLCPAFSDGPDAGSALALGHRAGLEGREVPLDNRLGLADLRLNDC